MTPRTTIFTCSIYPDLTRVWYHFIRRYADPAQVTVLIYDCGSKLRPEHFPGARIVRYGNVEHGKKIDHCIRHNVATPLLFLTDDDTFLLSREAEPLAAEALLSVPQRVVYSFRPRGWWEFSLDGRTYPVMGTDALVFKPETMRREGLSFRVHRPAPASVRCGTGYYDTGDYAQEQLIKRSYELVFSAKEATKEMIRAYTGVSSGFVNFAQRGWFSRRYKLTRTREIWAETLRQKMNILERACGVAAATSLHHTLFNEPPQFAEFFTFNELSDLAATFTDASQRDEARVMVANYRDLLRTLEEKG